MSNTLGIVVVCLDPNLSWLHDCIESIGSVADQVVIVDSACSTPVPGAHIRMPVQNHSLCNNAGVSLCDTDWIMLLDHDDLLITGNAELLKLDLNCHKAADVIVSPTVCFFENALRPDSLWGKPIDYTTIKTENHVPGGSWFRKRAWQQSGGFFTDCCPDWSFWCRLAAFESIVFHWNPAPIYKHRVWHGSGIHRMKPDAFKATAQLIQNL